jgi:hypothetical protein
VRRIGALLGASALTLIPLGGSGLARPLPLHGPQAATTTALLAVVPGESVLGRLDPATLALTARSARLGTPGAWVVSPDRRLLALGIGTSSDDERTTLRFANVQTLRLVRRGIALDGWLQAALWRTPTRLVALVSSVSGVTVETIDTVAKKVVERRSLGGIAGQVARVPGGLVVLVDQSNTIATATLAVVGADGGVRSVRLDRIQAGWTWPDGQGTDPIGTTRDPGLAVDPAGVAYVLDAAGLVASVDLGSLEVAYHSLSPSSLLARLSGWLTPPAEAKGTNGPVRSAVWLGDGLIALTGSDYTATRAKDGSVDFTQTPAGLAIVDTRDWTARVLDRQAYAVSVADGALLATGGASSPADQGSGEGLALYGADGTLLRRLFAGTRPYVAGVVGGLALVQEDGNGRYDVLDVATGRIVRSGSGQSPWPLVGSGS